MKRLSGLDTLMLAAESDAMPLHMMAILVLDPSTVPGGYSFDRLRDFIADRLPIVPPLRRRVVEVPAHLGRPAWVDVGDVDITQHVLPATLDAPATARELAAFAARIDEVPLPRDRPLWQMHVVDGLADGNVAVVAKVHHALMDGSAGMEFMASLFSLEPEPGEAPAVDVAPPDRVPSAVELLVRSVPEIATRPLRAVPLLGQTAAGLTRAARRMLSPKTATPAPVALAPKVPWSGPVTSRRNIAYTSVPLDDVKRMAKDNDVKVNDVVLSLFGGALRRYLLARDVLPERSLVAAVPVSTRGDGDLGGNAVTAVFVTLGTDLDDDNDRLQVVHDHSRGARELFEQLGADTLTDWTEVFSPAVIAAGAGLLLGGGLLARLPAICNAIVSNVPGPPVDLYFGGARLEALHPLGPILHGPAINVTVVSTRDTIGFGIVSCPDLVPDAWDVVDFIEQEYTACREQTAS